MPFTILYSIQPGVQRQFAVSRIAQLFCFIGALSPIQKDDALQIWEDLEVIGARSAPSLPNGHSG